MPNIGSEAAGVCGCFGQRYGGVICYRGLVRQRDPPLKTLKNTPTNDACMYGLQSVLAAVRELLTGGGPEIAVVVVAGYTYI